MNQFFTLDIVILIITILIITIFILISVIIDIFTEDIDKNVYTNIEIYKLGEMGDIEGACNNTVTYKFRYRDKYYLLTFEDKMELTNPHKKARKSC